MAVPEVVAAELLRLLAICLETVVETDWTDFAVLISAMVGSTPSELDGCGTLWLRVLRFESAECVCSRCFVEDDGACCDIIGDTMVWSRGATVLCGSTDGEATGLGTRNVGTKNSFARMAGVLSDTWEDSESRSCGVMATRGLVV